MYKGTRKSGERCSLDTPAAPGESLKLRVELLVVGPKVCEVPRYFPGEKQSLAQERI
jgi:hypothetical protein